MRRMRKDLEWEAILKQLMSTGIELTENYKEDYLNAMKEACLKVLELNEKDDFEALKHALYELSSWFYPFMFRMNEYNQYALENGLKIAKFAGYENQEQYKFPGSHNYNSYLRYLDRELMDLYYIKMVRMILEYIDADAEAMPEYAYELFKGKDGFYVSKLKWIETIGADNETELALPGYYSINIKYCLDKELLKEIFYKMLRWNQEEAYQKFLIKEYPIHEHVMKNLYKEEI